MPCRALGEDHRMGGGKVRGQRFRGGFHTPIQPDSRAFVMRYLYPAALGRQVFCGIRQSRPSSDYA
jgi:hypothetical protein